MSGPSIADATGAAALRAQDLGLTNLEDEEEALDVLDLPQLYTKPSARTLLSTLLHDLPSEPPSWDTTPRSGTPRSPISGASTPFRRKRKVRSEGVPSYLTKIISSPLGWIDDDEQKESIWEAASQRLSERSGRTAMRSITRTFVMPLQPSNPSEVRSSTRNPLSTADALQVVDSEDDLALTLFEPAITSDNLGLKTWASSYLLAKRMCILQSTLPPVPDGGAILELGSGTGLVGLAAAAICTARVILTDLPEIVENLERNSRRNAAVISERGGATEVAVLDWSNPEAFHLDDAPDCAAHSFPLILAADPIYSPDHPRLLVQAVEHHLSRDRDARAVVEMPLREAYGPERDDFKSRMQATGLSILDEGEEVGFDDWSDASGELAEVRCWWSVWGWR